jgi:signal transduction histidine kinase
MVDERTKQLHDAQEQLVRREKLAVLGQLAGGVGHELRNPLAVISSAVYYLKMIHSDGDETAIEYLDMISAEVHNSNQIIADLLDFARTRPPAREEISVSALVHQELERRPAPPNVHVIAEIPPRLPPMCVDPAQIALVLGNLITNAYQAMPDGGNLTISASADKTEVAIALTDTGGGISAGNMEKLFEPLFTTKPRGVGLGLATSRNLAEANGGTIEAESDGVPGEGSTFTLSLPPATVRTTTPDGPTER